MGETVPPQWTDRDERQPASYPATVELVDGRRFHVTIMNVSQAGCRIQTNELLPIGARLNLWVSGKKFATDVRWALPGAAGLRFEGED